MKFNEVKIFRTKNGFMLFENIRNGQEWNISQSYVFNNALQLADFIKNEFQKIENTAAKNIHETTD